MNILKKIFGTKQKERAELVDISKYEQISESQLIIKTQRIRDLGKDTHFEALDNLMNILQFDARGEVVIHASLALAGRKKRSHVIKAIKEVYNKVPPLCAAGYPPRSGSGIFPRMRLLYPIAWIGDSSLIKRLLDSETWEGASRGQKACYDLVPIVSKKNKKAIARQLAEFEYLDELGYRPIMDYTKELYPWVKFTSETWDTVKGGYVSGA